MGDAVELAKKHRPEKVVAGYEVAVWLEKQGSRGLLGDELGGSQDVLERGCRWCAPTTRRASPRRTVRLLRRPAVATWCVRPTATPSTMPVTRLSDMLELIAELYRPELAFLPIGDLYTMDPLPPSLVCSASPP